MEGSSSSQKRKITEEKTKNKKRNVRAKKTENKMKEKINGSDNNEESYGVFEFPWMKESMISTSLDWSLPESFFPVVFNDDGGNEMFDEISDMRWPIKRVSSYRLEFEALECIWTSILD